MQVKNCSLTCTNRSQIYTKQKAVSSTVERGFAARICVLRRIYKFVSSRVASQSRDIHFQSDLHKEAFGSHPKALGIIIVRDLPPTFIQDHVCSS